MAGPPPATPATPATPARLAGRVPFGLLATEVAPERRSATLNLVYLPLCTAGIIGPTLGAGVASAFGVPGPFVLGGAAILGGAAVIGLRGPRDSVGSPPATAAR